MAPKPEPARLAFVFGTVLAMAAIILAITTHNLAAPSSSPIYRPPLFAGELGPRKRHAHVMEHRVLHRHLQATTGALDRRRPRRARWLYGAAAQSGSSNSHVAGPAQVAAGE
jgi:hypothetical protein